MNILRVKELIEKYVGRSQKEVIQDLQEDYTIGENERNAVFVYLFPPTLLDRQIGQKILSNRAKTKNIKGWLEPEDSELVILLWGWRSQQYNRFMRHLLHSFLDPELVFPLTGRFKEKCALCDKIVYHFDVWTEECKKFPQLEEKEKKEFLAFGSKQSSIELCLDCLIQLQGLNDILKILEGENYLNKYLK